MFLEEQFVRIAPFNFDFFTILIYNIYTRSGEIGIIPFAYALPASLSRKPTGPKVPLVGQVEKKGETDFNNPRSGRCICPSKSIRRKVRG